MPKDDKIVKSAEEWRKELTPEEFDVIRGCGTDAPFTGEYVNTHDKGMYLCRACGAELFSSDTKFDSGSGWPSFYKPFDETMIETHEDKSLGMRRVEIKCARCGAHLGHVFDDGPVQNGGQRFCVNSTSLKLKKD